MENFAKQSLEERRVFFEGTASALNLKAQNVEKDFWVCWTLKELFRLPGIGEHMIFKGGTSLSKAFRIIERFSEDIDVSIDRAFLGFGGTKEPEAGSSNKEKRRRIEALRTVCQQKISLELLPALEAAIKSKFVADQRWSLQLDGDDPDQQTVLFNYPTSFPMEAVEYVRPAVKIEMGARSDHWPAETQTITAYVAEQFPKGFSEPSFLVKVLAVDRTFWEKATILHSEFHRPSDKEIPERFSRHYCDFYELIRKGVAKSASVKLDLLARVAEHQNLYFKSSWARYDEAAKGTLRLAPAQHRIKGLREDYGKMEQMFFDQPPEFEEIVAVLNQWELEFNRS